VARSADAFRLDALWPFAERLERYGIAGFGWGVTWLRPGGGLETYRSTIAFRDDAAAARLASIETRSVLVHLRRPSRLSTLQPPDSQPFDDPAGRFAFSHNGDLRDYRAARERYRAQGRIFGRADSEVGERWLEDAWPEGADGGDGDVPARLAELHRAFGGEANLAILTRDGVPHHYAGNPENPVFTFRLDGIGFASTAIYSIDRSLFKYAARGGTNRALARLSTTVTLDPTGRPVTARAGQPVSA
jgi:glutamine phosphoribosylpyrophosphate amidotransferase